MARNKHYKVICEEINRVLLIKKLSLKKEKEAYYFIKAKIDEYDGPMTIESYMQLIVNMFLVDSKEFFEGFTDEENAIDIDEVKEILRAVYFSIIEAYPSFELSFICADLNSTLFLEDEDREKAYNKLLAEKMGDPKSLAKGFNSLADIVSFEKYLKKNIIGQDKAISDIISTTKLVASGLYKRSSMFFIGPTGVGKTELARLLGKKYSGYFWKINCAEYQQAHEYAKLIGSPPGYIGHSEKALITDKAEKSNKWVILFDEIEKAHPKFYDFLLSLLGDGTCTDNMGRVLDFSESIFIFTSNEGVSQVKVGKNLGFGKSKTTVAGSEDKILESVKSKFSPEFINRIDTYTFFNTLTPESVREIAKIALKDLPIKKHKCLIDFIADNGFSEEYGARYIHRFIKKEVAGVVAEALLERRLPKKDGDLYTPSIKDGKLVLIKLEDEPNTTDQATT